MTVSRSLLGILAHIATHPSNTLPLYKPFLRKNLHNVSQLPGATALELARCLAQSLRGLALTEASERKIANQDGSEGKGVFTEPHI